MARKKKRSDGRLERAFRYNGRVYHVYGKSADELSKKEREKRRQLEAGQQAHDNPTLNQYHEHFLEMRRDKVKAATIRTNKIYYRVFSSILLPDVNITLGEMRIGDIKSKDMQQAHSILKQSNLSTSTINQAVTHIKHVFNEAVKDETIEKSPCLVLSQIKRTEPKARDTIHRALTKEETRAFFEAAKGNYYYNALALLLLTGLRIGELAALTETDIDTRKGLLHVKRTMTKDENGANMIGDTTKTEGSRRDIPLNAELVKIIQDQKKMNCEIFRNAQFVFPSVYGYCLSQPTLNYEIARICEAAGVERFTCHALRATFATRFIEQRPQDFKVLSEILGHSNINITLDLYTHVMNDTKTEAMKQLKIAY